MVVSCRSGGAQPSLQRFVEISGLLDRTLNFRSVLAWKLSDLGFRAAELTERSAHA